MKQSSDSTKQLKWQYGTRTSRLYEVSDHSVFNKLIAKVEHMTDIFVPIVYNNTPLASRENIDAQCKATIRSMERWLADEIAKKLT